MNKLDVLFVNPGNAGAIYQGLAADYSSVETPTWSLLLAQSCRSVGFSVGILDALAENLSDEDVAKKVQKLDPRLICFVVYGQNPNSGTVNMSGTIKIAQQIKKLGIETLVSLVGSHVQALPHKTLLDESENIDFIFTNEAVYALRNVLALQTIDKQSLKSVKGIGFIENSKPYLTPPERIVPQERMDADLPGYAWDLLPYKEKSLDLYRAHFWHAEYKHENRTPFAAIYTSLGCQFKCSFCMINVINRNDNEEIGVASNYSGMRFWSPEFIIKEFDKLVEMGVRTLRISDEMFLLNRKFYVPLCNLLIERGYGEILNMWAYSRVDTIKNPENIKLIRKAGIKWLCLGIESADKNVRLEVTKGSFEDVDITKVVQIVHDHDIEIIANYLVGLPGDNHETMQATLDLGLQLNTMAWNMYAAMALPGSQLFRDALKNGIPLPKDYSGFSFHSYDTLPLPTEKLSAAEILKFRDAAFEIYHTNPKFLEKIESKFGAIARNNIEKMTKIKLRRKIIEEQA